MQDDEIYIKLITMNLESIKTKLKVGIYIALSVIVAIIVVRVLLKLLGANEASQFAVFWYDLSYYFVGIFDGIYPVVAPAASNMVLETHSIVAAIVYTLLAGILSKSLTSISSTDNINRVKDLLDLVFKVMEFFLGFRFLLKLTGASEATSFVQFIYSASNIVYKPFTDLLPSYSFGADGEFILEVSTLIAIVVVVIFDVVSDILIATLKKSNLSTPPPIRKAEALPKITEQKLAEPVAPPSQVPPVINEPNPPYGSPYQPSGSQPNTNVYGSTIQPVHNYPTQPQGQSFSFNIGNTQPPQPSTPTEPPTYIDQRSVNLYPAKEANMPQTPNNPTLSNYNPDRLPEATPPSFLPGTGEQS